MIHIVDAIMGTGKSESAITYMNEHPDNKFIYITPYLDEADRIVNGCPNLNFSTPKALSGSHFSKVEHTDQLIEQGLNIATTHKAFMLYTFGIMNKIRTQQYTIIIDENVDVLESLDVDHADIQMAIDAGYIIEYLPGRYRMAENAKYKGRTLGHMFKLLQTRELVKVTWKNQEMFFFWQLPPDLLTSAKDVYILTYLFNGQSMRYFLNMYDIPYKYTHVSYDGYTYRFCEYDDRYIPAYVTNIKNMIHICDNDKLNSIGEKHNALSMNWYKRNKDDVVRLKNNVYNYFFNIAPKVPDGKMWSCYNEDEYKIRGKGYSKGFTSFNIKATNKLRTKSVLAYCVNIYMNVGQKLFYEQNGMDVDEDMYALSTMVQWIWRSAIRDGHEIWIYIPSRRMRELLIRWIDTLVSEDDNHGID